MVWGREGDTRAYRGLGGFSSVSYIWARCQSYRSVLMGRWGEQNDHRPPRWKRTTGTVWIMEWNGKSAYLMSRVSVWAFWEWGWRGCGWWWLTSVYYLFWVRQRPSGLGDDGGKICSWKLKFYSEHSVYEDVFLDQQTVMGSYTDNLYVGILCNRPSSGLS